MKLGKKNQIAVTCNQAKQHDHLLADKYMAIRKPVTIVFFHSLMRKKVYLLLHEFKTEFCTPPLYNFVWLFRMPRCKHLHPLLPTLVSPGTFFTLP